jgi:hypothetical protein
LTASPVEAFLADLQRTLGYRISTLNVRLAALHDFARFAAREAPGHSAESDCTLSVAPQLSPLFFAFLQVHRT